jgi:hypothetical protein
MRSPRAVRVTRRLEPCHCCLADLAADLAGCGLTAVVR